MNVNEEFDNSVELPVENMSKAPLAKFVTGVNSGGRFDKSRSICFFCLEVL